MNKLLYVLLTTTILFGSSPYKGSTIAAVTIAGGIVKAQNADTVDKKYKRKDCPVCKGQGWYISGDKITKVDCGYCEPESKQKAPEVIRSPIISYPQDCNSQNCKRGIK